MAQTPVKKQTSSNGQPKPIAPASQAAIVGTDHGQPAGLPSTPALEDALGDGVRPDAKKPPVTIDLDDVLGDEQALKHDLLEHTPPPIEVRAPRKREFIMVHPTYCRTAVVVEYTAPDGIGRTYYLATSHMRRKMEDEDLKTVNLVPCISMTDGALFLWPMNIDEVGTENSWNSSSRTFAENAKKYWARRVSHKKSGGVGYGTRYAPEGKELAKWPEGTIKEWIADAFKDRILATEEHPVYRDIQGHLA
jgi:hypothetical protein